MGVLSILARYEIPVKSAVADRYTHMTSIWGDSAFVSVKVRGKKACMAGNDP